MKPITLYIGLDVHKDSITMDIAQAGRLGELRTFGAITNDLHALEKALPRIRKAHPGDIPESTDEAIRDSCRSRTDAVDDLRCCRHRLKSFLLRHGYRYQGKANWCQPHMRYLRELVLPHPSQRRGSPTRRPRRPR